MTARFLLDTDICIYFQEGRSEPVAERIRRLSPGEAVLSAITYGELRLGAEKSAKREAALHNIQELITLFPVEPVSAGAAEAYGAIRAVLGRRGQLIGANDLWIAAHARSAGLTLVTNNEREFRRVPDLKVENWAAAA